MGVIQRQAYKNSIVRLLAVAIAGVSSLWIYPRALDLYGKVGFIIGASGLLLPLMSLGGLTLIVKFFPFFRDGKYRSGFLGNVFVYGFIMLSITSVLAWIFRPQVLSVLSTLGFDIEVMDRYFVVILALIVLLYVHLALSSYAVNFKRIVWPTIFNYLGPKVWLPVVFLLYISGHISGEAVLMSLLLLHTLICLAMLFYVYHLGELDLRPRFGLFLEKSKEILGYASVTSLNSISGSLALKIDQIMVPSLVSWATGGVYGIMAYLANVVEVPTKSLLQITSPFISQAWKDDDVEGIESYYKQTSINLFLIGLLIFLLIWFSLDDLFVLTGRYDSLIIGKYVVLLLGIGKLVDMVTSINGHIIIYSKFFRWNLYALIFLGVLNVVLTYLFLTSTSFAENPMIGAAIATLISMTLFQSFKVLFVWIKFGIHPFSANTIKVLLIGVFIMAIIMLYNYLDILGGIFGDEGSGMYLGAVVNILMKTLIISVTFVYLAIKLNISEEFTSLVHEKWNRVIFWK